MHEDKLYILEGTVPAGSPEPGLFQQSLGWIDENGLGIWYTSFYVNGLPAPRLLSVEERRRLFDLGGIQGGGQAR
jgi:hypothetical protein